MVPSKVDLPVGVMLVADLNFIVPIRFIVDNNLKGTFYYSSDEAHPLEVSACRDRRGHLYVNFKCEINPNIYRHLLLEYAGKSNPRDPNQKPFWEFYIQQLSKSDLEKGGYPLESLSPQYEGRYIWLRADLTDQTLSFINENKTGNVNWRFSSRD